MRKRSIFIFMVSFLFSLFHTRKAPSHQPDPADPLFFVGTWEYVDHRNRVHQIEIGPDLKLLIDGKDMSAKVSLLTRYELSYVDKFGYKLEIRGNEARPIKFYDESENYTYDLKSANATKKLEWRLTNLVGFLFGLMLTIDRAVEEMPDPLVNIAMPLAPIAIKNWHWQKNQLPIQFKARLGICLNEGGIRVWLS